MKNHRLLVIKSSLGQIKTSKFVYFYRYFYKYVKSLFQAFFLYCEFKAFFGFYLSRVFRKIFMLSKILKSNIRFSINLNRLNVDNENQRINEKKVS